MASAILRAPTRRGSVHGAGAERGFRPGNRRLQRPADGPVFFCARQALFRQVPIRRHLNSHLLQGLEVGLGNAVVGDDFCKPQAGRSWTNSGSQTLESHRDSSLRNFNHGAIYLASRDWACSTIVDIKPSTPRKNMRVQSAQRFLRNRPHQRKRVLAQGANGQDHFDRGPGQIGRNV